MSANKSAEKVSAEFDGLVAVVTGAAQGIGREGLLWSRSAAIKIQRPGDFL